MMTSNKPIKWGFKFWYHCNSKTGCLYHFGLYLGKKENANKNLGGSVVLVLTKCLKSTYCPMFFDSFFNRPSLFAKLFDEGVYAVETTKKTGKNASGLL